MLPNELARQQRAKLQLATGLSVVGVVILGMLFVFQSFPSPFWLWALFALAFVFFEWNTVVMCPPHLN